MSTRMSRLKSKLTNKKDQSAEVSEQESPKYVLLGKQEIKQLAKVFKSEVVKQIKPIRDTLESIQKALKISSSSISQSKQVETVFENAFKKYTHKAPGPKSMTTRKKQHSNTEDEEQNNQDYQQQDAVYLDCFEEEQASQYTNNKETQKSKHSKELNSLLRDSKVNKMSFSSISDKKIDPRDKEQLEEDCYKVRKLIDKRNIEDRNFTYEQKIQIMHLVDKARSFGASLIDLCRKTGMNKKWYRKWLEQLDKHGLEYS